jgi:thioredoxin 1
LSKTAKIIILSILSLVILGGVVIKKGMNPPTLTPAPSSSRSALPVLYEFGANRCAQCKKMGPIMEALREEYQGRLEVRKINIESDDETTLRFAVQVIPCQVLVDKDGKEVFRHEGFLEKEKIERVIEEMGAVPPGK